MPVATLDSLADELESVAAGPAFEPGTLEVQGGRLAIASCTAASALRLALRHGVGYEQVGVTLVNTGVNALLSLGALPRALSPSLRLPAAAAATEALVLGIVRGCRANGIALLGGTLGDRPASSNDEVTAMGTALGFVGPHPLPQPIVAGDAVVGLVAAGLHGIGLELAESSLGQHRAGAVDLDARWRALLTPTKSYLGVLRKPIEDGALRAAIPVGPSGLAASLRQALPAGCAAEIDLESFAEPAEMQALRRACGLPTPQWLEATHGGLGLLVVLAAERAADLLAYLQLWNEPSWCIGRIVAAPRGVLWRGKLA